MTDTILKDTPPEFPSRRLWTVEEYNCAASLGLFGPEERLELIEGEVIQKASPQGTSHATGIRAVEEALRKVFATGYDIRTQLPMIFGTRSEPEPDVAVVAGSFRDYKQQHPTTAVLVVEAAGTTLPFDRTTKAALYARAGIPEYWIVNLADRVLEVHRQPAPMAGQPLGHHYRSITRHTEAETVSPLAAPNATLSIAEFLP